MRRFGLSSKTPRQWSKLDNAAKIFPSNSRNSDTKVFRFCCQLHSEVTPAVLQTALEDTLRDFPSFQYVLRHGMFWYYLEQGDFLPEVRPEEQSPCGILYTDANSPLFEVTYHHTRINVEVYHALTDGAGALEFFRALVCNYLSLKHSDELLGVRYLPRYGVSQSERLDDSFDKYYSGKGDAKRLKPRKAYILHGPKRSDWQLQVFEGVMPADEALALAKSYNCTLTELLVALLIWSIQQEMNLRDRKRPVVVSVPVNLRKYFPSRSVRNFFSVINIGYDFPPEAMDLRQLTEEVRRVMTDELTMEYLQHRLDSLAKLEHNLYTRLVPLFLKDIALKYAYHQSENEYTSTFSNLGRVEIPHELCRYIDQFTVFNSTKDLQACACSFENKLSVCFTSRLVGTSIQRRFFKTLATQGVRITIASNL